MALFFGPLIWVVVLLPFYVVFGSMYVIGQVFWRSTSRAQIPAIVGRQFAKRGMAPQAARWYLKARGFPAYAILSRYGLFGPGRKKIRRFYLEHRDELPERLRDMLGNVLWADAFAADEPAKSGELASDNPSLIALATSLCQAAHRPKDAKEIKKLQRFADECGGAARVAEALRRDIAFADLGHRYSLERLASGVEPVRPAAKEVRVENGACCLCGTIGDWKGLDAYATVGFRFERSSGMPSGGMVRWGYDRFIGRLKVLFCDQCVPEAEMEAWRKNSLRNALLWASGFPVAAIAGIFLWPGGTPRDRAAEDAATLWQFGIGFLFICTLLVALFQVVTIVSLQQNSAMTFYRKRVRKFLNDAKAELVAVCDLTGSELQTQGVVPSTPTAANVTFDIEPGPAKPGSVIKGYNGVDWRKW
jgi:hypothetical protein